MKTVDEPKVFIEQEWREAVVSVVFGGLWGWMFDMPFFCIFMMFVAFQLRAIRFSLQNIRDRH